MRPIKFRAWDKINQTIIPELPLRQSFIIHYGRHLSIPDFFDNHDYTIMQFTGFTDKHDQEIYEGDIVKLNHNNTILVVEFSQGMFCFDSYEQGYSKHPMFLMIDYQPEIIGNVYENPELLQDIKETYNEQNNNNRTNQKINRVENTIW